MKVIIMDHDNFSLTMEMTAGVLSESIRACTHRSRSATRAISGHGFKIGYLLKDACFHNLKWAEEGSWESVTRLREEKWFIAQHNTKSIEYYLSFWSCFHVVIASYTNTIFNTIKPHVVHNILLWYLFCHPTNVSVTAWALDAKKKENIAFNNVIMWLYLSKKHSKSKPKAEFLFEMMDTVWPCIAQGQIRRQKTL